MEIGPFSGVNAENFDHLKTEVFQLYKEIKNRNEMTTSEKKSLQQIDTQLKMFYEIEQNQLDHVKRRVRYLLRKYKPIYDL